MGNPKAFLTIHRQEAGYRPVHERIDDFSEVEQTLNSSDRRTQASRCMDCGVPFCHWACPLGNKQPEWQDLLYKGRWREAFHVLEQTCDFPEFTGRICPALCEKSCVLKLSCDEPVTIRENEASIVEAAFREGYIQPVRPIRNGKRVAVIGRGPAGLTAANQLNRRGYEVTVFEKYELPGGLLRFGIPNFKLGKNIIDRRIRLMEQEGIVFKVNTMVGNEVSAKEIASTFDAVCIAIGSEVPRDLPIEGRNLKGVHFALELLSQQNRILEGIVIPPKDIINCKGKKILIIGGGDTGSDCVGTVRRQGAGKVYLIDVGSEPPEHENKAETWPNWPRKMRISTSHEEGCEKLFQVSTKEIVKDKKGEVTAIRCVKVKVDRGPDGRLRFQDIPGTEFEIPVQRVYLAMGFLHPSSTVLDAFGVEKDTRGNAKTDRPYFTSREKVFACGDARRGQSLIVTATSDGRQCAAAVDAWLMGRTALTVFAK